MRIRQGDVAGEDVNEKEETTSEIVQENPIETEIPSKRHSWTTVTYTLNGVRITEVKCSVAGCGAVQSHTEEPIGEAENAGGSSEE